MKVKSVAISFPFTKLIKAHTVLDDMLGLSHARAIVDAILGRSKSHLVLHTDHASRNVVIVHKDGKVVVDVQSSRPLSLPESLDDETHVVNNKVHVAIS